jgi:serine/threonine-protein kinase
LSLVWVDRGGQEQLLPVQPGYYGRPRISPDGKRIAAVGSGPGSQSIWIFDTETGGRVRLAEGQGLYPLWTPDGVRIFFGIPTSGIYSRRSDASGDSELVLRGHVYPASWSPDGKALAIWEQHPSGSRDILVLPRDGKPSQLLATSSNERSPRFSPDGRWLAYVSDDSGRDEVYVQPYPGPGPRALVSVNGGAEPVWSSNQRELFYRPLDGTGLRRVTVGTQSGFSASTPEVLFATRFVPDDGPAAIANYDITPDGKRFVMIKRVDVGQSRPRIHVVLNWFEELTRRVPTN